ncbi:MAG TPA: cytochrome d ubiquinol oxidase subunit II [bacterium]|jgi:cytochrome d ubiquinol oxidase subunit II
MIDLNTIWFILLAVLFIGYALLDGFDLGVGILSLFSRDLREKRLYYNAIGPVWDGNEVWLLTGGGALFAAFPIVYATVFSGFYLAFAVFLIALIARAVALEFRGKFADPGWQRFWDWCFGLGSLIPALLLGVALGNILRGLPIGENAVWQGSFFGLLNPFSILIGLLSLTVITLHGAIYLASKTGGDLQNCLHKWIINSWTAFVLLYVLSTFATVLTSPHLFVHATRSVLYYILLAMMAISLIAIPRLARKRRYGRAFLASSLTLASQLGLAAVSLFPLLVPARPDPLNSLTIYNASSSPLTLKVMLIIALIGMPFVIFYTVYIYRTFRGKVDVEAAHY